MTYNYYYNAFKNYFWRYEEDGSVITLSSGATIVYREHLLRILDRLAINGLPCLTALLVVLAAARRKEISTLLVKEYTLADYRHRDEVKRYLQGALELLKIIGQLPEEFRRGDNELLLLETIFKNSHNQRTRKASNAIVQHFRDKFVTAEATVDQPFIQNLKLALRTLYDVSLQIKSVETLLEEMKRVVPVAPEEVVLETVDTEEFSSEKLLEELNKDPLTFRVGSLIKHIWGGLRIPFKNNHPGNQPLGGFADITNKGNFDKLLPTEFANEEVVFLSRLANNEALYFQRELPPVDNQLQRIILIDVSLKNWGTIKTLSHAIMLAVAYHPQGGEQVNTFLVGKGYHAVEIESLSGILAGLRKMSTALHPVAGLENYFAEYPAANQEILYIGSAETVQHPEMKALLAEHPRAVDFWIHPNVEGTVNIFKRKGSHKNHVKTIRIPYKEIWEKAKPTFRMTLENRPKVRLLEANDYPILFPATSRLQFQVMTFDGHVFEISKDGHLYQSPGPVTQGNVKGMQLIMENLPIKSGLFAIGENARGEQILLMISTGNKKLILLNLVTQKRVETEIPDWKPTYNCQFEFFEGFFWYPQSNGKYWRIDPDGEVREVLARDHDDVSTFIKLQVERRKKPYVTPRYYQVFKRSRRIFINNNKQLVFSSHMLYLNSGGVIKIDTTTNLNEKIAATALSNNEFEFADGSRITHHRAGMLIFNSSNLAIPAFYIPSILNKGLAIASEHNFAGAPYFYYDQKVVRGPTNSIFNRYVNEFIKQILEHGA